MSLLPDCGWSALRGLAIVICAAPVCLRLVRFLRASETQFYQKTGFLSASFVTWGLLLIPFLTPDLLVGYAYGNFSPFPLVRHPWMCELLYGGLLLMKLVPVGVVLLYFSPPSPLSAEAAHCRRFLFADQMSLGAPVGRPQPPVALVHLARWTSLGAPVGRRQPPLPIMLGDWLHGSARQLLPATGLVFLLAFQEFELGALLGISAGRVGSPVMWTRTLFDSQAGIIDRLAPLKWSLWPLLFNLLPLAVVVRVAVQNAKLLGSSLSPARPVGGGGQLAAWSYLSLAVLVVAVVPTLLVLRESLGAFTVVVGSREQFVGLLEEIMVGLAFAGVAGLLAYLLAAVPLQLRRQPSSATRFLQASALLGSSLTVLPGLAGSLIVGLSILYLFQTGASHVFYDSPLPLAIALVLFLAPRALLLQLLFRASQPLEPVRLTALLSASTDDLRRRSAGRLFWALSRSRHFWATALLAFWAYWDLTSTTLLHPSQMVPASVRLYNLMHYGHSAVLSAMTILAVGLPLLIVFLLASIIRPLSGRFA